MAEGWARTLNEHYGAARQSIRAARRDYEQQREAADASEGRERGAWAAQADMAAREWGRALGAAAALERLADALGVGLDADRRSAMR